jgi:hypothetical protein
VRTNTPCLVGVHPLKLCSLARLCQAAPSTSLGPPQLCPAAPPARHPMMPHDERPRRSCLGIAVHEYTCIKDSGIRHNLFAISLCTQLGYVLNIHSFSAPQHPHLHPQMIAWQPLVTEVNWSGGVLPHVIANHLSSAACLQPHRGAATDGLHVWAVAGLSCRTAAEARCAACDVAKTWQHEVCSIKACSLNTCISTTNSSCTSFTESNCISAIHKSDCSQLINTQQQDVHSKAPTTPYHKHAQSNAVSNHIFTSHNVCMSSSSLAATQHPELPNSYS